MKPAKPLTLTKVEDQMLDTPGRRHPYGSDDDNSDDEEEEDIPRVKIPPPIFKGVPGE